MPTELFYSFLAATVILILIPGPNVALIISQSLKGGIKSGLLTVVGTSSAMALQLTLTVLGMTALLSLLADWFEWLRLLGAAYLIYLGFKIWSARSRRAPTPSAKFSFKDVFWRGFIVSLINPKTLFFYGAFFPQFITPTSSPLAQMEILAITFLAIAIVLDSCWALAAAYVQRFMNTHQRMKNRIAGFFLMGAGIGLALARRN